MKTWFISDTHFHHANILTFTGEYGNLIRPGFDDVEHMNEFMVERWNSVVKKDDKVYHLGDVVMKTGAWAFEILDRLNGNKILIKGNHDNAKLSVYAKYFKDVRSEIHLKSSEKDKIVFTHRPIRFDRENEIVFNCHGHIHQRLIDDYRYINLSVECINYTPVSWQEINESVLQRKYLLTRDIEKAEHGIII